MSLLVLQLVGSNKFCKIYASFVKFKYLLTFCCIHTAVGFLLHDSHLGNKSVISLDEIGEGANALLCLTNNVSCCEKDDDGTAGRMWYFPNSSHVPLGNQGSRDGVYITRGPSVVRLHRRRSSMISAGIFHCEIIDASGTNQSIYIGVYPNQQGAGILEIISLIKRNTPLLPTPPTHTLMNLRCCHN